MSCTITASSPLKSPFTVFSTEYNVVRSADTAVIPFFSAMLDIGRNVPFSLRVLNIGPSSAKNLQVLIEFSNDLQLTSVLVEGCIVLSNTVTCQLAELLPRETKLLSGYMLVAPSQHAVTSDISSTVSNNRDNNPSNNQVISGVQFIETSG